MVGREQTIRMLRTSDVAWLLSTDKKTVCRWADAGIIRAYHTSNRGNQRFKRDDVARLLAKLGA